MPASSMKVWLSALLLLGKIAAVNAAEMPPPGRISAEISSIAYLHAGDYLVQITISSGSAEPLDQMDIGLRFAAQSDILGRWIDLAWRRQAAGALQRAPDAPLSAERTEQVVVVLPMGLPHLFRNHEGDVNMRFQYRYVCQRSGAAPQECAGESAYWITPGTDRWVLREGM